MWKLSIHDDCHPVVAQALQRFNEKISSSHSTTARSHKYSIWSLLAKEVEPGLVEALGADFFSAMAGDGFAINARKDAWRLEEKIRAIARAYSRPDRRNQRASHIFGTLETLISVIHFCKNFRPHTFSVRVGNECKGEAVRRLAFRRNLDHFPFCELCERLCEAEEIKIVGDKSEQKEGSAPSSRFCRMHKPGEPAYRRDHNRRNAFHQKIIELGHALGSKTYTEEIENLKRQLEQDYFFEEEFADAVWAGLVSSDALAAKEKESRRHLRNYPDSYSEFDAIIRAVAYRIVHPKKEKTRRKTSMAGKGATLRKLKAERAKGKSISDASKEAGVSRQAGWKALKKAGDI